MSNASNGDGVYKSSDGGKTWRNIGPASRLVAFDCAITRRLLARTLLPKITVTALRPKFSQNQPNVFSHLRVSSANLRAKPRMSCCYSGTEGWGAACRPHLRGSPFTHCTTFRTQNPLTGSRPDALSHPRTCVSPIPSNKGVTHLFHKMPKMRHPNSAPLPNPQEKKHLEHRE